MKPHSDVVTKRLSFAFGTVMTNMTHKFTRNETVKLQAQFILLWCGWRQEGVICLWQLSHHDETSITARTTVVWHRHSTDAFGSLTSLKFLKCTRFNTLVWILTHDIQNATLVGTRDIQNATSVGTRNSKHLRLHELEGASCHFQCGRRTDLVDNYSQPRRDCPAPAICKISFHMNIQILRLKPETLSCFHMQWNVHQPAGDQGWGCLSDQLTLSLTVPTFPSGFQTTPAVSCLPPRSEKQDIFFLNVTLCTKQTKECLWGCQDSSAIENFRKESKGNSRASSVSWAGCLCGSAI